MMPNRNQNRCSTFSFTILLCLFCCICNGQEIISASAKAAVAANDFKPAIEELSALIAKDQNNVAALTNRANFYQKAGMPEKALADAQLSIKINSQNYNAVFIAGSSLIMLNLPEKAIPYFDTALMLKPDWLQALQFRGKLFMRTEQYESAIKDLTRVIDLDPDGAEAYLLRARAYVKKYQNQEANMDYIQVTNIAPEDSKVYELAKEEIQAPIKEYEELKAAMSAPVKPSKEETAQKEMMEVRKELWETLGTLSMKTLAPSMELSLAKEERDRAAFNTAREAVLKILRLKEDAFTKAERALKEINHPMNPENAREIERAHNDNLQMIRDFTDASF